MNTWSQKKNEVWCVKNTRNLGAEYEERAAAYLREQGYFIIERNYRVRQAEIDIVARDGSTIVFAEVKYRANLREGHPLEAVGISKQRKISRAALFYLNQHKISVDNTQIRFDVIGILGDEIVHIRNAFDYRK